MSSLRQVRQLGQNLPSLCGGQDQRLLAGPDPVEVARYRLPKVLFHDANVGDVFPAKTALVWPGRHGHEQSHRSDDRFVIADAWVVDPTRFLAEAYLVGRSRSA